MLDEFVHLRILSDCVHQRLGDVVFVKRTIKHLLPKSPYTIGDSPWRKTLSGKEAAEWEIQDGFVSLQPLPCDDGWLSDLTK